MARHMAEHPGFALLMTLMLLAVAAVVLASLGRHSAQHGLHALTAQEQLERRWALRSAEHVLLPQAPALFEHRDRDAAERYLEPNQGRQLPRIGRTITLGSYQVNLYFTNEQAKINLNALARPGDQQLLEQVLRGMYQGQYALMLRPLGQFERQLHDADGDWPVFASFSQILPHHAVPRLAPQPGHGPAQPGVFDLITLWGDGRIHWHSASDEVLEKGLAPYLEPDQIRHLIELSADGSYVTLDRLFQSLNLSLQDQQNLSDRLVDESNCFGLWIVKHDGRRWWHQFSVLEEDQGATIRRMAW